MDGELLLILPWRPIILKNLRCYCNWPPWNESRHPNGTQNGRQILLKIELDVRGLLKNHLYCSRHPLIQIGRPTTNWIGRFISKLIEHDIQSFSKGISLLYSCRLSMDVCVHISMHWRWWVLGARQLRRKTLCQGHVSWYFIITMSVSWIGGIRLFVQFGVVSQTNGFGVQRQRSAALKVQLL